MMGTQLPRITKSIPTVGTRFRKLSHSSPRWEQSYYGCLIRFHAGNKVLKVILFISTVGASLAGHMRLLCGGNSSSNKYQAISSMGTEEDGTGHSFPHINSLLTGGELAVVVGD